VREGLDGLGGHIFGGGEFREDLAGLAEGDAGAVLEGFCDAAVCWREGGGVVVEDSDVGVRVEVGSYGEQL